MKILSIGLSAFEMEYEGKVLQFGADRGEAASIGHVRWVSWDVPIEGAESWLNWLKSRDKPNLKDIKSAEAELSWCKAQARPYDSDVPITLEDKLEIMRNIHRHYLEGEGCDVSFIDDRGDFIYFDLFGNTLVDIENETIRSSKVGIACFCDAYEEVNEFSDADLELLQLLVARRIKNELFRKVRINTTRLAKNKKLRKVPAWQKNKKSQEEWYECKWCKAVWRLVYPDASSKGLFSKARRGTPPVPDPFY